MLGTDFFCSIVLKYADTVVSVVMLVILLHGHWVFYDIGCFMFLASSTDIIKTKAILFREWSSTNFTAYRRRSSNWQNSC